MDILLTFTQNSNIYVECIFEIAKDQSEINNIDYTRLYGPVVLDKIRSTGITFDNIVKAGFASEGYNIDLWSPVSIKGGKNLKILLKYNI